MRTARFLFPAVAIAVLGWLLADDDAGQATARFHDSIYLETTKSNDLVAVDAATGRSRTLPIPLNCGDALFCLVPSGGKLVIGSLERTSVYDPSAPGRPRAHRIGRGWTIVPSQVDGRVWLSILDRHRREIRSVREKTVSGRLVQNAGRPFEGRWPLEIVNAGFLFQGRHRLVLWDPGAKRVIRRFRGVFIAASSGNLVAHCGEPCPDYLFTHAETGKTVGVRPPSGYSFRAGYDGAFSPDGSLLAVPVLRKAGGRRRKRPSAVALIDVKHRTARVIRSSRIRADYTALSWADSGALYFSSGGGAIKAYDPADSRARRVAKVRGHRGGVIDLAAL